jgi:Mg2+/Co2+ transporter CorC
VYTNPRRFSLSPLENPRGLMKEAKLHKPGVLKRMQTAQRMMAPAEFVHESGHLAVYPSIDEAKSSLEGLLLAKGWNQQE